MLEQALQQNTEALNALHKVLAALLAAGTVTTVATPAVGFVPQTQPVPAGFVQPPAVAQVAAGNVTAAAATPAATAVAGFAAAAAPVLSAEQITAQQTAIMELVNQLCGGGNATLQQQTAAAIGAFKNAAGGPVTNMQELQVSDYMALYTRLTELIVAARGGKAA